MKKKKNCNLEFILGFMDSLFFHFTYEECAEQKWEVTKYKYLGVCTLLEHLCFWQLFIFTLYIFIQISVSSTSYISKLNLLFWVSTNLREVFIS